MYLVWRGRDEAGSARIVVVATDPVLLRADATSELLVGCVLHQPRMDGDDLFDAELLRLGRLPHGELHCVDIVDQLERCRARSYAGVRLGLCASHLSHT